MNKTLNNLQAFLYLPAVNVCKQANAFQDTKGHHIYEFAFQPHEANGDWSVKREDGRIMTEVVVIFRGKRRSFFFPVFYKEEGLRQSIYLRYGKYDKQLTLRSWVD